MLTRLKITAQFLSSESASGYLMLIFALCALILENFFNTQFYSNFIEFKIFGISLKDFTTDFLMVFFFFVVGLELKQEVKIGFLSKLEQIALPLIAASFGMLFPAIIFLILNFNSETSHGWAIPSATDIAFAVCVLKIFSKNFPSSARIFLLAIAIFDDLGAILIIALFYSNNIELSYLFLAFSLISFMGLLNYKNVSNQFIYYALGLTLTYLLYKSGIHTTIAGVLTAFFIPLKNLKCPEISPLNNSLKTFHKPVAFFILPLFTFVSCGIDFSKITKDMIFSNVCLGVILGLFFGKQLGIFLASFCSIKLGWISKPKDSNWLDIYIISVLAGIGFTMSLFITALAFDNLIFQEQAKLGIVLGSLFSTILGAILLKIRKPKTLN